MKLLIKGLILVTMLVVCLVATLIIGFLFGNPLLPVPSLAQGGWAWHHIPEILGFFLSGVFLGVAKNSGSVEVNRREIVYFVILTGISLGALGWWAPYVVVPIVTVPSLAGYLVERWYAWRKKREAAMLEPSASQHTILE